MQEAPQNPLIKALDEWLPSIDLGIMAHGFAPHGRDYIFIVEDSIGPKPGTYQLILTHVVELSYCTRVADDSWAESWGDEFTDYETWLKSGEPGGYVWGSNWSLAYPGIEVPTHSEKAENWSKRLGKPMFEMKLGTDRFSISLIFHDLRVDRVSDDTPTVSRVIFPIE
jgi:hypothetical protein